MGQGEDAAAGLAVVRRLQMTKPRVFFRWMTFCGPLLAACSQSPGGGEIPAPVVRDTRHPARSRLWGRRNGCGSQ